MLSAVATGRDRGEVWGEGGEEEGGGEGAERGGGVVIIIDK